MRRRIVLYGALVAAGAVIVLGIGIFIQSWAMLDMNKITALPQSTVIYDDGNEAVEIVSGSQDRTRVKLSALPPEVVNAFLAAEDARFYSHHGIDFYRIGGALLSNIKSLSYSQGASTITQQLIKLTHLSGDKTIERKIREAVLALRLETVLSKDEILEAYLNTVYFGGGAYGIDAAARRYFAVGAGELSLSQGALLAGVIKSPSSYAPHINYEKSLNRRNMILGSMAELGYITKERADQAVTAVDKIVAREKTLAYDWYAEEACEEAAGVLGVSYDELIRGGYRLYTALDVSMQKSAQELFGDGENFPRASGGTAQAALVAVDAKTGEVMAVVGGRNRQVERGLNRASDMLRQPGSAFKPISVYAAAVDRYGFTPTSFIEDALREYEGGYTPGNITGSFYGAVTLREALSRSLNAASVDLITKTGVKSAGEYAKRAGISLSADDDNLSLALGSLKNGVSPMALAGAYTPLANGGGFAAPHFIKSIYDAQGNAVYQYRGKSESIMSRESARLITDMLITAVQSGTAKNLNSLPFTVAGKTGTVGEGTRGNRDVWNVAYTPNVVCCVWMGCDEADGEHCLPNSVTGSNYPTRLAAKFISANADKFDGGEFATPSSLVTVPIDKKALRESHKAMLISDITPKSYCLNELFAKNNVPTKVSDAWNAPSKIFDLYVSRNDAQTVAISFTSVDDDALYQVYRINDGGDELLAEQAAPAGEKITVECEARDRNAEYYVVGLEKTLHAEGILLAGERSDVIREARAFHWDAPEPAGEITIIEQTPLF